jgi:hypothetical protein
MKETTKIKKAIESFKKVAKSCKDSWLPLEDHETTIAGNHYFCHAIPEDQTCYIFEVYGIDNSIQVAEFKI